MGRKRATKGPLGGSRPRRRLIGSLALPLAVCAGASTWSNTPAATDFAVDAPRQVIAPLVQGDEPIVVSQHTLKTVDGPLTYEAQVGRLAIRRGDNGEVHGYIFFVAYRTKPNGHVPRPITFAWNGGPGVPSSIIHLGGVGPRMMVGNQIEDSPETLLRTTDLVFMDAMETGFSRPARERFASEFFTLRGDVAASAEFIRAFRTRLRAMDQPVFVAGESYGVFRAAALSDFMVDRGDRLDGTILISGDFPNVPQPVAFYDAMHIPARAATAFYYKRLPPDLMRNRSATMKAVVAWAINVYQPALEHLATLSEAQKDRIIAQLARYTGMKPEDFSRETLVMHVNKFLAKFLGSDGEKPLSEEDTRVLQAEENLKGSPHALDRYLRDELGYNTDLSYSWIEDGYRPEPGPKLRAAGGQFDYDLPIPSDDWAATLKAGEVTWIARDNPPWMPNALRRDKKLRVFVATGRFDPLNMCEGDVRVTAQLPLGERARVENHCYESGHVIYDDPAARHLILEDLARFIDRTVAATRVTAKP
jgi:carboxypeptidase C (cathepsin A)